LITQPTVSPWATFCRVSGAQPTGWFSNSSFAKNKTAATVARSGGKLLLIYGNGGGLA